MSSGLGTNAVDHLVRVPVYPAFNSKVELSEYAEAPGGEVASTMVGLTRLGFSTAYIGKFGSDHAGRIGLSSLIDEGVDIAAAETVAEARTQIAFIIIDGPSGERTVIWHSRQDACLYGRQCSRRGGAWRTHFASYAARYSCLYSARLSGERKGDHRVD